MQPGNQDLCTPDLLVLNNSFWGIVTGPVAANFHCNNKKLLKAVEEPFNTIIP
jgi:hypothetical protein